MIILQRTQNPRHFCISMSPALKLKLVFTGRKHSKCTENSWVKKKKSKFYFAYWSCTFVFQLTAPSWHQLNQWTGGWKASWNFSIFSSLQMRKLVQSLAINNLLTVPEGTPSPPTSPHSCLENFLHTAVLPTKITLTLKSLDCFSIQVRNGSFEGVLFLSFFFPPTRDSADTLLSSKEHS